MTEILPEELRAVHVFNDALELRPGMRGVGQDARAEAAEQPRRAAAYEARAEDADGHLAELPRRPGRLPS